MHRFRRVARSRRSIKVSVTIHSELGSHPSDNTRAQARDLALSGYVEPGGPLAVSNRV